MTIRRSRLEPAAAALACACAARLCGCASVMTPEDFAGGRPEMRPEVFFAGRTSSSGVLEDAGGAPVRRLHVEGEGRLLADGAFRLDQTVRLGSDPPTRRTWILRRLDAHRYAASLTDAAGAVEAQAFGDLLHLRYATRTPPAGEMEQWLYLQPDGRTVVNEAVIRVFGVAVARISERISRETAPLGRDGRRARRTGAERFPDRRNGARPRPQDGQGLV